MSKKTVLQSTFDAYPESIQKSLLDQGFTVVADPVAEEELVIASDDLLAAEEQAESTESGIWLNVAMDVKGTPRRVIGQSLDFALFRSKEDREAGKEDSFIRSIINTIEKHGVETCNEKMTFTVTISKQGESGISADTDLLA